MKKGCGITLLVFAALNLIAAFVIAGSGAPADAIGQKFRGAFLLAIIGGALYYYGTRKKDDKQVKPINADVSVKETAAVSKEMAQKAFSSSVGDDYESLFEELKAKCHPKQFMEPYDHEKVKMANELYSRILKAEHDDEKQNELRQEAIEKLGVSFSSRRLYDKLIALTNPANFMNPYDAEKVAIANDYYQEVQENAENELKLEKIWKSAHEKALFTFQTSICYETDETDSNNGEIDNTGLWILIVVMLLFIFVTIILVIGTSSNA